MTRRAARSFRHAALLLACAGLSACAGFGERTRTPAPRTADTLEAQRALDGIPVAAAAWPQRDWWRPVGDAQLDALIDEALADSPTLDMAAARRRAAQAAVDAADAARAPSLTAAANYSGVRIPDTVGGGGLRSGYVAIEALSLRFAWQPDLWGGQRARYEAAVGRARAAEVDAQAARIALSVDVARAYTVFAHAAADHRFAEAELARTNDVLTLTRQRVDAGIDSQAQLARAEGAVPAAQQQLAAAQLRIDAARAALSALLGKGPDRGLAIDMPRAATPFMPALPSLLPADLLGRRPDLVAARWRAEAALKDVKAAETAFYPNFNLAAAAGLASNGLASLFEAGSRYEQIGPALSLPIFDGGRLRASLARADAEAALAVADYDQKLADALRDVATAIANLRSLEGQHAQQAQALASARQARAFAQQRYHDGVGNRLDVLAAQAPVLAAQGALEDLHIRQLAASLQLVQALGGGWQGESVAANPSDPTAATADHVAATPASGVTPR